MYMRKLEIWQVIALSDIQLELLARLVGILIVDDAETILPQELMPFRPPTALLLSNGKIRTGRGYFLPDWAVAEVDRLAAVLCREHRDYLENLSAALRQEFPPGFVAHEPGMIFEDAADSSRVGPPPPQLDVDLSQSDRMRLQLKWYQVVAEDYRRNRYLTLLTVAELGRRAEDIVGNIHVLNEKGLVSFERSDPTLFFWLSRLQEVQAEMALRHGPYPAGWKRGMIEIGRMPSSLRSSGPKAAFRLSPREPLPERFLVKYGERRYMEAALQNGDLRISPASNYDDASLNQAMQDDELSAEVFYDPSIPFNEVPPGTMLLPVGRVPYRQELKTDFYVYCLADELSTRLMLDFERDACLIIRDPEEFLRRISVAVNARLDGWQFQAGNVEYFDPLNVTPAELRLPWSKHFRYAYQKEVRLVWLPPYAVNNLEPLDVSIGALTDIAEVILPEPTDE